MLSCCPLRDDFRTKIKRTQKEISRAGIEEKKTDLYRKQAKQIVEAKDAILRKPVEDLDEYNADQQCLLAYERICIPCNVVASFLPNCVSPPSEIKAEDETERAG